MASRKGIPNKTTAEAKENIQAVFIRLGGTAAMATWASENQTEFYKIYSKLLPIKATIEGRVSINWPLPKSRLEG